MRTYYPSLPAIEQQTGQLEHEHCAHCKQAHQLVSHGFVRRKRVGGEPEAVGKRVFCSNRNNRMGALPETASVTVDINAIYKATNNRSYARQDQFLSLRVNVAKRVSCDICINVSTISLIYTGIRQKFKYFRIRNFFQMQSSNVFAIYIN